MILDCYPLVPFHPNLHHKNCQSEGTRETSEKCRTIMLPSFIRNDTSHPMVVCPVLLCFGTSRFLQQKRLDGCKVSYQVRKFVLFEKISVRNYCVPNGLTTSYYCHILFFGNLVKHSEYRLEVTDTTVFFGFSYQFLQKTIPRNIIETVELASFGWDDSGWERSVEPGSFEISREWSLTLGFAKSITKWGETKTTYASKCGPAVKITYKEGNWKQVYVFSCDDPVQVRNMLLPKPTGNAGPTTGTNIHSSNVNTAPNSPTTPSATMAGGSPGNVPVGQPPLSSTTPAPATVLPGSIRPTSAGHVSGGNPGGIAMTTVTTSPVATVVPGSIRAPSSSGTVPPPHPNQIGVGKSTASVIPGTIRPPPTP